MTDIAVGKDEDRVVGINFPACWTWPVGEVEHEAAYVASLAASKHTAEDAGVRLLEIWQADRCAACGGRVAKLEADHDHDTGFLRGLLCHSCNVSEAHAWDDNPIFSRYRFRTPMEILGVSCHWAVPDSARAVTACLGPDVAEALARHQAERDPARRR